MPLKRFKTHLGMIKYAENADTCLHINSGWVRINDLCEKS